MMKKNLLTLAAVLCCAMTTVVFTACTDNDDNPVFPDYPTAQAEYTILFYGYGGSNLDDDIFQNMMDFYNGQAESYKKVKIACQYKYSSAENLQKYWIDNMEALTPEVEQQIKDMDLQTIRFIVDNTDDDPDSDVLLITPTTILIAMSC